MITRCVLSNLIPSVLGCAAVAIVTGCMVESEGFDDSFIEKDALLQPGDDDKVEFVPDEAYLLYDGLGDNFDEQLLEIAENQSIDDYRAVVIDSAESITCYLYCTNWVYAGTCWYAPFGATGSRFERACGYQTDDYGWPPVICTPPSPWIEAVCTPVT